MKECKYCYGKRTYSQFRTGGEFGDSFDGHVTVPHKIEIKPCPKCNTLMTESFYPVSDCCQASIYVRGTWQKYNCCMECDQACKPIYL